MSHVPAATEAVQLFVPSLTVTLPVGAVGLLPNAPVTPKSTVTGSPVTELVLVSDAEFVITAVVSALPTVRLSTLELVGAVLSWSTLAEITAVPTDVAWKLPVAVPAACTVPWVDDRSPLVAAQVTDRPTSSARSPAGTAAFAEFVRKLAVRPVDWLTTTGDVAAVSWLRYHGVKPSVPPEVVAVSQGAAPGPVLQPHQLLVAVTVPASTLRWSPLPSGALLPTISDLDRLTLLLPT